MFLGGAPVTASKHQADYTFAATCRFTLRVYAFCSIGFACALEQPSEAVSELVTGGRTAGELRFRPVGCRPGERYQPMFRRAGEIVKPRREIEAFERFCAIAESWFVTLLEILRSHQSEVAHRELSQTFLDSSEIEEQYVADLFCPVLDEQAVGIQRRHKIRRAAVRPRKFHEFGLL